MMRRTVMASVVLAGAVLLLGIGGYLPTLSSDNGNANATVNASVAPVLNVSANITNATVIAKNVTNATAPVLNISLNGSSTNTSAANVTSNSSSLVSNSTATNTTIINATVTNSTVNSSSRSGGSSGSSGSRNRVQTTNKTATGVLHFNDCLHVSLSTVCLADISTDAPNDAILAVYDAQGKFVSNVMITPGQSDVVSVSKSGNANIRVYYTVLALSNGTLNGWAYVTVSDSNAPSDQTVPVYGALGIGDCIKAAYASACLSNVSATDSSATISVYWPDGRPISVIAVPSGETKDVPIGNGKAASITVSQAHSDNASVWAAVSMKLSTFSVAPQGSMLLYGDCMNTSNAKICLEDIVLQKPHEAVLSVSDRSGNALVSNVIVAPGSSRKVNIDSNRAVTVSVAYTYVNGSMIWAIVSATDSYSSPGPSSGNSSAITATLDVGECINNSVSSVCLADISVESGHDAMLGVYDADGTLVSNVMIAPGASKSVQVGNSTDRISVQSTVLDLSTSPATIQATVTLR